MGRQSRMGREVVIAAAARTPIGSFQGALSSVPAPTLGATAIRAAVERAGVPPADIGLVTMGCVLQAGTGQAPARQASRQAGLSDATPTVTTHKVCGSGMESIVATARAIALGEVDVAVAGGMENMSASPHVAHLRSSTKLGDATFVDSMLQDGLLDPESGSHMGAFADECARENEISREDQDAYTAESYRRAQAAQTSGAFAEEIVPVTVPGRKGDTIVDLDEEPSRGDPSRFATLRPAFGADGTVTAANASSLNDGAAAVVLMSAEEAERRNAPVLARITGWGAHAQAPSQFAVAPSGAMANAADAAGVAITDIDLWEINEAFAVVALANMRRVGLTHETVNVRGGAVALGHPLGASGTRIVVTLLHAMAAQGAATGGASLCIGGGEGIAITVSRDV